LFWEINSAQTALIPRPTRQSLRNHLRNEGITETGFRPAFLRTTNARDENGNVRFNDRAFVHNNGTCRDERISYVLGAPFELLNVIWFRVRAVVIYTRICVAKCYNVAKCSHFWSKRGKFGAENLLDTRDSNASSIMCRLYGA